MQETDWQKRLLASLGDIFAPAKDRAALLEALTRSVGEHFNVSWCGYSRVESSAGLIVVECDFHNGLPSLRGEYLIASHAAHLVEDGATGKVTVVEDLKADPRTAAVYNTIYQPLGVRAHITVPLLRDGRWTAIFWVCHREPRTWRIEEISLMRLLGDHVWLAAENARIGAELRAREREIRRERDYAEATFRSSPVPLLVLEGELRVAAANDAFYKAFSTAPDETEGRVIYDLGGGQWNIPKLRHHLEELRVREAWFRDVEVTRDFERIGRRTLLLHARRAGNEAESPDRTVLVVEDITKRKKAEEALRESEDKLRHIFEAAKDYAILSMDVDGRFTSWNSGAERIFGLPEPEALGKHFRLIFLPEDQEQQIPEQELAKAREKGRAENERWHVRKDGSIVFASGLTQPIYKENGGPLMGYTKICQDRTEHHRSREALRESEERYRSLFTSMDEGFCVIEVIFDRDRNPLDYRFLETNPAFPHHTGLANPQGKTMREMIPLHDPHWFEIYGNVALTGEPTRFESVSKTLNRWFNVYAFRIGRPNEHKVAVLFTDITKQKRAEEEIRRSQRDLGAANEQLASRATHLNAVVEKRTAELTDSIGELEAFSYSMAHDLRGPLRAIQGLANILRDDYGPRFDHAGQDYLARIASAAERMHRLISDVLTYSRISKEPFALERVELHPLIVEVIDQYPTLKEANILVTAPFPAVLGNRSALTQVISNLLTNAVKFVAANRQPEIEISAENQENWTELSVRDNGIGIAPENQNRIFQMFERIQSDKNYEGTGIGLAIVRRAVARMGGTVGIESAPGQGSRFWAKLRRADAAEFPNARPTQT